MGKTIAAAGAAMMAASLYLSNGTTTAAYAQQVMNLSEDQPLKMADALPTKPGQRELQFIGRYDRTRDGKDQWFLEPGLQAGFTGGWQGQISIPYIAGTVDNTGWGDFHASVFKQLNPGATGRTAFALSGEAAFPTAEASEGIDTALTFIVSTTLRDTPAQPRLHLNAVWKRNARVQQPKEFQDGYLLLLGYSQILGENASFVADVFRDHDPSAGETQNMIEIGYLRQVTQQTQIGFGLGAGIGADSPKVRAVISLGHSL